MLLSLLSEDEKPSSGIWIPEKWLFFLLAGKDGGFCFFRLSLRRDFSLVRTIFTAALKPTDPWDSDWPFSPQAGKHWLAPFKPWWFCIGMTRFFIKLQFNAECSSFTWYISPVFPPRLSGLLCNITWEALSSVNLALMGLKRRGKFCLWVYVGGGGSMGGKPVCSSYLKVL